MKVLVIEDDEDVNELVSLCIRFQWPEANVTGVKWGERGVQVAKAEDPDLVVLDIGLPDIDGYEVLRRIREFSDIPVVMLTGRNRQSDIELFLKEGALADDYILKPFGKVDLITRIGKVLEARDLGTGLDVPTAPFEEGDELYEGTVWLEVRGEATEGQVVNMLRQLRHHPELRPLRLTHVPQGGVKVRLGLRRPVRLAAIIRGMVGINEVVPMVDSEETGAGRGLTVTLDAVVPTGPRT